MNPIQAAKQTVLDYCLAFDHCAPNDLQNVLHRFTSDDYQWSGMYPFYKLSGQQQVCDVFWQPLRESFTGLQRRPDVFLAGRNCLETDDQHPSAESDSSSDNAVWVCQMGHLMGLFDRPWLDIPPTHRLAFVRYAEFHKVVDGLITESALFFDLISVMRQAGQNPLPPQTGSSFIYPGPRTHDGLLYGEHPSEQGEETLALVNRMITDLSEANEHAIRTGDNAVSPAILAKTWHQDMIWYGPEGIGATYTIERYQHQHQYPFRYNLGNKKFNGHVTRFAEGNYACFFGWPNLTNTSSGGFLGMTGSNTPADMRVVDVYRRDGEKLAENWVLIDLPHWLSMQGLDVLARMRQLLGIMPVS